MVKLFTSLMIFSTSFLVVLNLSPICSGVNDFQLTGIPSAPFENKTLNLKLLVFYELIRKNTFLKHSELNPGIYLLI